MSTSYILKMIAKTVPILALCIYSFLLTELHALRVSFSESDVSVTEGDGQATVIVTKTGLSRGNITCTLIPLSLAQARLRYGYQLDDNLDPAEIDEDFSPVQLQHVFGPGAMTVDQRHTLSVVDDDVYEREELFVVKLNISVSDATDENELEVGKQFLLIRISPDGGDVSTVRALMPRTSVSEGAGLVENFITLYRDGLSELSLSFTIGINVDSLVTADKGIDYELQTGEYTLLPTDSNITLPLHVIEDDIAEGVQTFTWTLSQAQTEDFQVQIIDNDVVTVRLANSSEMVVKEGDTVTVCAEIVSPSQIDTQFFIFGSILPGTAQESDYTVSNIQYSLDGNERRGCQDIRIVNDALSEATEEFSLSLISFPIDSLIDLEPDTITFIIKDNDIPELQVTLPANVSASEGVTLTEGDDDVIVISVPEMFSIPVLVSVTASHGSAEKDADFEIDIGNYTLNPGNSSVLIPLSILDDEYVENNEHFTLIISQLNSGQPPLNFSFTIVDNDRVTVGFANDSTVSVVEGEVVRVCGGLVDTTPNLLQREIVLEGYTISASAVEGSDFKAVTWNFTLSPSSSGMTCVEVDILDDSVPEVTETFSVTIQPVQSEPLISVQQSSVEISINDDDAIQLKVQVLGSPLSNVTTTFMENDGTLDNLIRIFSPGDHPFGVDYQVSTIPSSSDDFSVKVGTFTFEPTDKEHFLSVTVLEDDVAEEDEEFSIIIAFADQPTEIFTFTIIDNDDLRVGFANGSNVSVIEGQTAKVCAVIISPEAVNRSVLLLATTEPGSATEGQDYFSTTVGLTLSGSQRTDCADVVTIENKKLELPRKFKVQLEVRGQPGIKLEQDLITVEISDNDGSPLAPVITDTKLLEDSSGDVKSYNLMFAWEVKQDDLRPVDSFSGTVTASTVPRQTRGINRERRQDNVNRAYDFVVDNSITEFTAVDIVLAQEYTVEVCSRNRQGFNCSSAVVLSLEMPSVEVGTVEASMGEVGRGGGREEDAAVTAGVAIAVVIVVLFTIVMCIVACICFLPYWRSGWTSYHPEGKEKKYEKEFERYRRERRERTDSDSDFDSDLGDEV